MVSERRGKRFGFVTAVPAAFGYPACPDCLAGRGDPCRTPSGKTRHPHHGRNRIAAMDGIPMWWDR